MQVQGKRSKNIRESSEYSHGPQRRVLRGEEWTLHAMRLGLLATFEALPLPLRPRCFLKHSWRANFVVFLRELLTHDPLLRMLMAEHQWQLEEKSSYRMILSIIGVYI